MSGKRGPTHTVLIGEKFIGRDNKEHMKWYKVGTAWQNDGNKMNFRMPMFPGVNFQIVPMTAQDFAVEAVDREIDLTEKEKF